MTLLCHQCGIYFADEGRYCAGCGALREVPDGQDDPLVGRTIGGAYMLQALVGVGGMGRVYRAEQRALGRTVAVKVIHPHLLGDQQTTARFYTEARAASRLNHPNSVGIIDFGRGDDGILYLVMEFLQGKDLALVMQEEGPLPLPRILELLIGVLGALGEAHALGVVHRDLKPENIITRPLRSGVDLVKVVDFGLATILGGGATSITTPGLVCGTPDYMSPEQGRGDDLDGRSDLYALGVVLFELLTDELPFPDETPTKVVLRHINDPVPDPRQVAPLRGIPKRVAEIAMRALAKTPDERFLDAEDMATALREALDGLRHGVSAAVVCPSCGNTNPESMNFCGVCGTRLTEVVTATRPAIPRTSFFPSFAPLRPLVGRADELLRIATVRGRLKDGPIWLHVAGEAGTGKTRLLSEVAALANDEGDLVVGARPHPTRAPVPFFPVRDLLASLLAIEDNQLERAYEHDARLDTPIVRAGLSELFEPTGLSGLSGESRVDAVTAAVASAIAVGLDHSAAGRLVVLADDFELLDGLSQSVLAALAGASKGQVFLVTAGTLPATGPRPHDELVLRGIDRAGTEEFFSGLAPLALEDREQRFLPLYLEQLEALGEQFMGDAPPLRLADAVAQRLEQLPLNARRLLQAAAVLGDRCSLEGLREFVSDPNLHGLHQLKKDRFLREAEGIVEVAHPFLRDLVVASIPAEARRSLHHRAFQLAAERDAPLEVRAGYVHLAGETLSALMLLERMGDAAVGRGDSRAAILAYRRALDLARREVLETGDLSLEAALLTFSRKLGQALCKVGDHGGADGVLREALDLAAPFGPERVRMLVALAEVARARDRKRDAFRHLGQALEIVTREGNGALEADVQRALARLRSADGQLPAAANALRRALELEREKDSGGPARIDQARTLLELGITLADAGELVEAERCLREAVPVAQGLGGHALLARIEAGQAALLDRAGRASEARRSYSVAADLAAKAGDVVHQALFQERAAAAS